VLPESLTINPAPASWGALLRHNPSPESIQFRRELNLPTDLPIIMTGHQPEFWHPGILAKYLAADAASAALNAHPVWLFVDQDRPDSITLRYPAPSNSSLTVGTATVRKRNLPTIRDAHVLVQPGIDHIRGAFARHSSAPTLSHQLASTLSDLIAPLISLPHSTLFATQLSRTTLFQSLVQKMSKDPESCITTYNAAATRHASAGIRALIADDIQDRWELPLWHLPTNLPRKHVYAEDLPNIPINELAPKALFMTGLLRLAACDLFIHGTGGAGADASQHQGYDLITEDWFNSWFGAPLAPMTLVTATRYLPLSSSPPPTAADVAHARWRAHHTNHDPAMLNDHTAAATKHHLLDQLALLPRHSRTRSDTFRKLHDLLSTYRQSHSSELAALESQAHSAAQRFAEREVIFDRTWPFSLYPDSTLAALRDQVRTAFRP
jgi:hypothetical protein